MNSVDNINLITRASVIQSATLTLLIFEQRAAVDTNLLKKILNSQNYIKTEGQTTADFMVIRS